MSIVTIKLFCSSQVSFVSGGLTNTHGIPHKTEVFDGLSYDSYRMCYDMKM